MVTSTMSPPSDTADETTAELDERRGLDLLDLALPLAAYGRRLLLGATLVGAIAYGLAGLLPPQYTAKATILPPQQQQGAVNAALASLGPFAALGAGIVRSPSEQYVALMQSDSVVDRIVGRFKLMEVYETEYRSRARDQLRTNARITLGRKDGLISIEVDDNDPQRAAELANAHVDELRRVTSEIAVTEAQQRRKFFEQQLEQTRDRLTRAQIALQQSGFTQGALKAEPRAAAESYARLKADVTAAEVRVQAMRGYLNENAPEYRQALTALQALRAQLARAESAADPAATNGSDYITKYRDFKYQETLFDLFARQLEMARLDESREGAMIQVVDVAAPPELPSGPRKARIAAGAALAALLVPAILLLLRQAWRASVDDPARAARLARLKRAWSRSR
jgi:uncharacterized protein involved in exopolysaccharide biosynthesis